MDFSDASITHVPVTDAGIENTTDHVTEFKWLPELDVTKRLNDETTWFKLALVF